QAQELRAASRTGATLRGRGSTQSVPRIACPSSLDLPGQSRLFGRSEADVGLRVVLDLALGELQLHLDDERCLGETDLRRVRVVRGPPTGRGRRLVVERSMGSPTLRPLAMPAGGALVGAVESDDERFPLVVALERDRFELAIVRGELVGLARDLRGGGLA